MEATLAWSGRDRIDGGVSTRALARAIATDDEAIGGDVRRPGDALANGAGRESCCWCWCFGGCAFPRACNKIVDAIYRKEKGARIAAGVIIVVVAGGPCGQTPQNHSL